MAESTVEVAFRWPSDWQGVMLGSPYGATQGRPYNQI